MGEVARFLNDRLNEYNRLHAEDDHHRRLAILVRDTNGTIVAGLLGDTYWGWLHIEIVWVHENLRYRGYGRRLVAAAEEEARRRGCHHAHLSTMSFQALSFYERQGYTVFGTLDDMPVGHSRSYLRKALPY